MTPFKDNLLRRAGEIAKEVQSPDRKLDISLVVKQEIALVFGQIEDLEEHYATQKHSLIDAECQIVSDLMQLDIRLPKYSSVIFPEREKLLKRLHQLGSEKRRLSDSALERFSSLESQLLSLLAKHDHITHREDGNRQTTQKT